VYVLTYAFYISSLKKGDVLAKQINLWKEDDIEEAKEYDWDGKGSISSTITFEFPHLVKTLDVDTKQIILAKDLNRMVYKDYLLTSISFLGSASFQSLLMYKTAPSIVLSILCSSSYPSSKILMKSMRN